MNSKLILAIIIIGLVLTGFFLSFEADKFKGALIQPKTSNIKEATAPSPSPKTTINLPEINEATNLKDALEQINPPAFTEDFKLLRSDVDSL